MTQCNARVQLGTYTYAARNGERQCGNRAQANGFCAKHQSKAVTPEQSAAFEAMKANITKG